MPQLDLLTFFPQVFWGFLFFFIQFFIISYYFLPLLASTLKFKQKYLSMLFQKEGTSTNSSGVLNYENNNALLLSSIKEVDIIFGKVSNICHTADTNFRLNLLTKTFANINNQIIKTPFLFCALPRFYSFCFSSIGSKAKPKTKKTKR